MPRTTLDIDPSVLRELRQRAAKHDKSIGRIASELLAGALADGGRSARPKPLAWTARDLGRPRIDLEDKEAVRSILDRAD